VHLGAFLSFAGLDVLLVMTPGADWAFAIAAGLKNDGVVAAVAGLAAGYVAQVALVVIGLGALLARNAAVLRIITFAGAAYLLTLGITVVMRPAPITAGQPPGASPVRSGIKGATVSGLNPKGLLLFFAILPQFVIAGAGWPVQAQLAALGLFHVAACCVVYLTVALGASRLLRSRPPAARTIGRLSGAAMILIAVALTADRIIGG
jgi:threonine/homoserine/homoserine lactone efflux protein